VNLFSKESLPWWGYFLGTLPSPLEILLQRINALQDSEFELFTIILITGNNVII
jgi:hypothetical protein